VFEKSIRDGKVITKKIDMPYDDNYFEEIMPISSNYYNDSSIIRIKNKIFNELIVNSQKTGDYGFEHDNLLYYVCRSGEFLKNNNSYTLLSTIEKILKKKTDLDCYVINKNEVTTIFFVKDKFDIENSWSTSTESIIIKLPRAFELLKQLNVKIDNVAIVDDHDVPRGVEVGKLKRNILSKYVFPRISDNMTGKDIDGFLENVLNEQLSELLDKDSNVKISGNTYHFSKVNFNIIDIFTIILNYNVSSFHEIDDEYILIVDNSFIDAKHPNDVIKKKDFYKLIHDYISKNQINNIKIDLNTTFNGLEIIIDNYKFEEIMDLEHYDLINFSDFNSGEEWVLFTYDASDLRYMVGKVRINDEGDYYVDIEEPAKDHLNIPFYFTVNEKDGKMVLEENYNLYFDENKGNKTYTLKKR
jgi:hypothetical protein